MSTLEPSAVEQVREIHVRWTDDVRYIRKWDFKPFEGSTAFVVPSPNPEGLEKRARELLEAHDASTREPDRIDLENAELEAFENLRCSLAALSVPQMPQGEAGLREAIRRAKVAADKTYGIAWHQLEEISRFELVLAELPAQPSIRSQAVEECARVAEQYPSLEYADIAIVRGIASAIRSLGSNRGGEGK